MIIRCPVCKEITTWEENPNRPFCSERCRLIDLGKWAMEQYKIEGGEQEEDAEQGQEEKAGESSGNE